MEHKNKNNKGSCESETSQVGTSVLNNVLETSKSNNFEIVKNENNCMVVKTPNCFYKIRRLNEKSPACPVYNFEQTVIQAFCSEYKAMGLNWDVFNIKQNNTTYLVEKRQKLKTFSPNECDLQEIINKGSKIIRRVEKRLEIPLLAAQIKLSGLFEQFSKIVLARDSSNNLDDFAIWHNEVILLGNSNWFLAMLDNSGKWNMCQKAKPVAITLSYGEYYFAAYTTFSQYVNALDILKESSKWWLFKKADYDLLEVRQNMKSNLTEMIQNNIEVAANKERKIVSTEDEFGTMLDECKKYRAALKS